MATGIKANNVITEDGESFEDRYAINLGTTTNATRDNFFAELKGSRRYQFVDALYIGSSALTLSEFNNLPIGSRIWAPAIATPSVYLKTAATTFKLQAINT